MVAILVRMSGQFLKTSRAVIIRGIDSHQTTNMYIGTGGVIQEILSSYSIALKGLVSGAQYDILQDSLELQLRHSQH
jgi:hypothetical protein